MKLQTTPHYLDEDIVYSRPNPGFRLSHRDFSYGYWNARASARKGPERFKEILIIKLYNQLGVCMLSPYIIPSTRSSFGAVLLVCPSKFGPVTLYAIHRSTVVSCRNVVSYLWGCDVTGR